MYILPPIAFSPLVNRAALSGRNAVARMAEDLRLFAASNEAVTADDLELLGWTSAQIASHGAAARQRAYELAAG